MDKHLASDKQFIWHPFTPLAGAPHPVFISSARGIYLHTPDGRKIIDAISSWWVNIHGHSNPVIAKAIAEQALNLEHVIFAGFTHQPAIDLAVNLLSILPENQKKIFFSDNGSTAVEVALKMAFQYWFNRGITKRKVIALKGAYHGDTFGSMSVGDRGLFTDPFQAYLFEVSFLDFPEKGNEHEILKQFTRLLQGDDVGAFIYEPLVQAAAGMKMYSPALLDALIEAAHQHDVVCIADEVFTGFGRTGEWFASQFCKHDPDIVAMSKGITGGTMPLGVTSCSSRIVEAFVTDDFSKTFFHGHSYTANPLACAAANASFGLLMKDDCRLSIERIARQHVAFRDTISYHPAIQGARCMGTIIALELKTEEGNHYSNSIRKKIYRYFLDRDILLRPLGNTLYVLPPYVIQEAELNLIYSTIREFLDAVSRKEL
jgi:adenosylmethionine-8-amino-7-oxononanoate aminotransferase